MRKTLAFCLLLALTACTSSPGDEPGPDPDALRIVAGSEQQSVIERVVKPWCDSHGHKCDVTLKGSVDQARLLAAGGEDYDAWWFASSVFLQVGDKQSRLRDVQPMFLTPVVFAAWKSEMEKLGFAGRDDVDVADILAAVESGKTTTWITNPTQSNSGATVLFGFLNHFAGNDAGTPLTAEQLDEKPVVDGVSRFVRAMDQTPPSTGVLMDECVARPDECRSLFTYEDLVIEKNLELVRAGREPLVLAYPRGALAVSDAPLGFLPHGDGAKQPVFAELQKYLLTDPGAQKQLAELGRRPAGGVGLNLADPDTAVFNPDWGVRATIDEQPVRFPATQVIEATLDRYQTRYRRPVAISYCLDGSGSMSSNNGWTGIEAAAKQVFDQDQAALNYLRTHPEDSTTVTVFASSVVAGPWNVQGNDATALHGLTTQIENFQPTGGTNMYACLDQAVTELAASTQDDRKRLIVLMTDGRSATTDYQRVLQRAKEADVPVVAIAFGTDTDPNQLREVAEATGGAFVQQDDLVTALRQAAGYK